MIRRKDTPKTILKNMNQVTREVEQVLKIEPIIKVKSAPDEQKNVTIGDIEIINPSVPPNTPIIEKTEQPTAQQISQNINVPLKMDDVVKPVIKRRIRSIQKDIPFKQMEIENEKFICQVDDLEVAEYEFNLERNKENMIDIILFSPEPIIYSIVETPDNTIKIIVRNDLEEVISFSVQFKFLL